jgi:hypothetical protein
LVLNNEANFSPKNGEYRDRIDPSFNELVYILNIYFDLFKRFTIRGLSFPFDHYITTHLVFMHTTVGRARMLIAAKVVESMSGRDVSSSLKIFDTRKKELCQS